MVAEFDETVFIKAEPAAVFAYLSNTSHHPLWSAGLKEVMPAGPLREGEHYKAVNYQVGQRIETNNLVTKLEPGKRLEIYNEVGPIQYRLCYSVQPAASGTHLKVKARVESNSPMFHFAKPIFEFMAKTRIKADMDSLKGLAESDFLKKHSA